MIGVLVTVICIEASGGSLTLSRLLSFSPFCAVNTLFATVNLVAGFAGASPKVPFAADASASTAPKVEFK